MWDYQDLYPTLEKNKEKIISKENIDDTEELSKFLIEFQEIELWLYRWLDRKQQEIDKVLRDENFEKLQQKIRVNQEKIKQLIKNRL